MLRLIPSKFPPIGLFDTVATRADIDAVLDLSGWSNDRLVPGRLARIMVFRIENRLIFGSERPSTVDVGNHLFSVIAVKEPIDGRRAIWRLYAGPAPVRSCSVPLCVPGGQLVSSGLIAPGRELPAWR